MIKRFIFFLLASQILSLSLSVSAGVVSTSYADTCVATGTSGPITYEDPLFVGGPAIGQFTTVYKCRFPGGTGQRAVTTFLQNNPSGPETPDEDVLYIDPNSPPVDRNFRFPDGPQNPPDEYICSTLDPNSPNGIICNPFPDFDFPNPFPLPFLETGCRIVDIICRGILGKEFSPFSLTFLSNSASSQAEDYTIPFVVGNIGDGDWLSMSVNGVEFLRRPLSDFTEGILYMALAPSSLFNENEPSVINYFLESTGEANAEVYFITETQPVPLPASAWLFVSALSAMIGIQKYRKD